MDCSVVITANGKATRMGKYGRVKYDLMYMGKTLLQHLLETFPNAKLLTSYPSINVPENIIIPCKETNSRKETLEYIADYKNVLIVDCDIYVTETMPFYNLEKDTLYIKIIMQYVMNSGIYFVKDMETLLSKMQGDEIGMAMTDPTISYWETIHLGTEKEYEYHKK